LTLARRPAEISNNRFELAEVAVHEDDVGHVVAMSAAPR